jgi:hypothetical protein
MAESKGEDVRALLFGVKRFGRAKEEVVGWGWVMNVFLWGESVGETEGAGRR